MNCPLLLMLQNLSLEHNVTKELILMKRFSEQLENLLCCRMQVSETLLCISNGPKMVLLLW